MNTLTPIESLFGSSQALFGGAQPATGVSGFENALRSVESTRPTAEDAKLQFLTTEQQVQQTTFGMLAAPSTHNSSTQGILSMALQEVTAPGSDLGIPAWAASAQQVMGDAFPKQVIGLYTQAQQLLTGNSTFSTLF